MVLRWGSGSYRKTDVVHSPRGFLAVSPARRSTGILRMQDLLSVAKGAGVQPHSEGGWWFESPFKTEILGQRLKAAFPGLLGSGWVSSLFVFCVQCVFSSPFLGPSVFFCTSALCGVGWGATHTGCKNKELLKAVNTAKEAADLHTNIFAQYVIWDYLKNNDLEKHIAKIRDLYKKQSSAMLDAIKQYFPVKYGEKSW